tara:strand:- start:4970 stop:5284 length:315 start_codon:yes stop_codon:yes gene_type:complete
MHKEELPGASTALTMGIIALVTSFVCCGPFAAIFSFIGLSNAKKARLLYEQNPELYTGYENAKTGKILSIIGLIVALFYLILFVIYFGVIIAAITAGGLSEMQF